MFDKMKNWKLCLRYEFTTIMSKLFLPHVLTSLFYKIPLHSVNNLSFLGDTWILKSLQVEVQKRIFL